MSFSLASRPWAGPSRPRPSSSRHRAASRVVMAVATLEGRALLSHLGVHAADVQIAQARRGEPREFLNISTGTGRGARTPRFRHGYAGPRLPSLNVTEATARVDGSNLVLTATL